MTNPHIYRHFNKILEGLHQLMNILEGLDYCPVCEHYGDHDEHCLKLELDELNHRNFTEGRGK